MANDATPITGPESVQEQHKTNASIRLIIADTEPIFRVGIRKVVALEDDIRVVAQTETLPQTLASLNKFPTDVLLFGAMMSPNPADAVTELMKGHDNLKIVLVSPELGEEQTVDFLRRGVRGIVTRSVSPDLLVKCVKKVHVGETWLDNQGVNWS